MADLVCYPFPYGETEALPAHAPLGSCFISPQLWPIHSGKISAVLDTMAPVAPTSPPLPHSQASRVHGSLGRESSPPTVLVSLGFCSSYSHCPISGSNPDLGSRLFCMSTLSVTQALRLTVA